jgi:hypothetical protein
MINILGHHVNKSVSVSIPVIFKDNRSRPCRLVGVEVSGLWLEGEELSAALLPKPENGETFMVFVPFAQISYLVESYPRAVFKPSLLESIRKAETNRAEKSQVSASKKKQR